MSRARANKADNGRKLESVVKYIDQLRPWTVSVSGELSDLGVKIHASEKQGLAGGEYKKDQVSPQAEKKE